VRRGRERKLEAFRDGALAESQRCRIERDLEQDLEASQYVERSAALGTLIREAWSEGPSAPSADRLLAAIAPEMRRIDAERDSSSAAGRSLDGLGRWLRDGLDAVSGKWLMAAGAAAAVFAAFLMAPATMDPRTDALLPAAVERFAAAPPPGVPVRLAASSDRGPEFVGELGWPSAVYDLAQEDVPLMVSEKDGAIVILLGEPEPVPNDDISSAHGVEGLA
jgi:hypothetical protein